ncbi:hypothetical protein [Microbacterium oleivorans]|uniref:Uncharacterized protein n=1 Tax=Microbacterium oleivorans TaxID=273677 RepID=A0A031FUL6_9MICO|nr:hypothetical protein [Microbacterium oleivorans]AZS42909.1 hypothetical protein BWL13_00450 [Microbacterium oleivorans]EZP28258.1 hypothetical protein BW34_01236 [Microbacterium oleivorans]
MRLTGVPARSGPAFPRNGASLVLDIVYVLGVLALFVIIGLFAKAVDRL